MKKALIYSLIVLAAVFSFVACSSTSTTMTEAEKDVYYTGFQAAQDILSLQIQGAYHGTGSVTTKPTGSTTYIYYDNCSDTFISKYSGTSKTVSSYSGQMKVNYGSLPNLFPATQTVDVSFKYNSGSHSVKTEIVMTSSTEGTVKSVYVDGKQFDPSLLTKSITL